MRLVFIPGFGEDQRIFSHVAPRLPGTKVYIHNLDLIGVSPVPAITAIAYARRLIEQHQLRTEDVLIGHSMGGWVGYAIKQLIDCPLIQISSWTDPKKVNLPLENTDLLYWLIRKGWCFKRFNKQLLLGLTYRNQPSLQLFSDVYQNLMNSPPEYVINQLRVIVNPYELVSTAMPELRIHSQRDSIVRFPDQPATCVPGDHFNLFTHPQAVLAPINALLAMRTM